MPGSFQPSRVNEATVWYNPRMLKTLAALVGLLVTVALIVVNLLGGLIAGIWLAALGEWRTIFLGFAFSIAMPWAWMIASLPTMALAGIMMGKSDRDPDAPPSLMLIVPGALYTNSLICAWVLFVFWFFEKRIDDNTAAPFLLWAYSTAMSPLAYMASKERDGNWAESLGIIGAIVTFVVLLLMHLFDASMTSRVWGAAFVAVALGFTAVTLGMAMEREQKRMRF